MYLEGNSGIFQLDACSRNWLPFIPHRQGLYCLIAYSHMCTPIHCCHMSHGALLFIVVTCHMVLCYSSLSHGALLFMVVTWCSAIHRCHMEQSRSHVFYLWVLCSGICTESATSLGCWTWKSGNGWHFHSAFCHLCHLTCYWVGVVMSAEFANTFCRVFFSPSHVCYHYLRVS